MQGELLSNVWEMQVDHPGVEISSDPASFQHNPAEHPKVAIFTPDCDLLTDYLARYDANNPGDDSKLLQHIQCCDVYEESEIRPGRFGSDLWRRIRQNQDERYHCLPPGETEGEFQHPTFFLDFKRMFSLPTQFLYDSLDIGEIVRRGVIPPIWLHSLIQRYFAFHSRVGVPDPNDQNR